MQDGLKGKFMPTKAEQKVLEESAINDKIKAELSEAKIKGIPKINPDKIDVSKFTFDNSHINAIILTIKWFAGSGMIFKRLV